MKTIILKIMSESKTSPRSRCPHSDTAQVWGGNHPPGMLCPLEFRLCSALGCVCMCTWAWSCSSQNRSDNAKWRGHRLGSFQGWRTCPAGMERLWECVYCPRPAAGPVLPFPVPTDAIPSQSRGQLRHRNGNSSRPRECTAGKSIISVIYRLQLYFKIH